MNVQPTSAGSPAMAMSHASPMAGGKYDNQYQSAMQSVADLLGMTPQAMQNATKSQSLAQLASSKNVSEGQLASAITAGMQKAGTQLSGARLDNVANRIANHRPRHHRAPVGAAGDQGSVPGAGPASGSSPGWSATAPADPVAGGGAGVDLTL